MDVVANVEKFNVVSMLTTVVVGAILVGIYMRLDFVELLQQQFLFSMNEMHQLITILITHGKTFILKLKYHYQLVYRIES